MTPPALKTTTLLTLWLVVIVEIISPVPLALTLGAVYVLLARPPWFLELVRELYARPSGADPAQSP